MGGHPCQFPDPPASRNSTRVAHSLTSPLSDCLPLLNASLFTLPIPPRRTRATANEHGSSSATQRGFGRRQRGVRVGTDELRAHQLASSTRSKPAARGPHHPAKKKLQREVESSAGVRLIAWLRDLRRRDSSVDTCRWIQERERERERSLQAPKASPPRI